MRTYLLTTVLLAPMSFNALADTRVDIDNAASQLMGSVIRESYMLGSSIPVSLVDATLVGASAGMAANLVGDATGAFKFGSVGKDSGAYLVSVGALVGLTVGLTVNSYSKYLDGGDALGKVWVKPEDAATATDAEDWVFNDTYARFKSASDKLGLKMECEKDCKPEYNRQQKGKRYLKFSTESDTWWMTWTSGNFVESMPDADRKNALGFNSGYESQGLSSWRIRIEGRILGFAPYPMKGAWNTSPWKEFLEYVTDNSTQHLYITPEANAIFYQGKRIASNEIAPKSN